MISSADFMMELDPYIGLQLWMKREWRNGLSTQTCGTPVSNVTVGEQLWPDITCWSMMVRKSMLQMESLKPGLVITWEGVTELKSTNNILAYCPGVNVRSEAYMTANINQLTHFYALLSQVGPRGARCLLLHVVFTNAYVCLGHFS